MAKINIILSVIFVTLTFASLSSSSTIYQELVKRRVVRGTNVQGFCICRARGYPNIDLLDGNTASCATMVSNCERPVNYTINVHNAKYCLDVDQKDLLGNPSPPRSELRMAYRIKHKDGSCTSKHVYTSPSLASCEMLYNAKVNIKSCGLVDGDDEYLDMTQVTSGPLSASKPLGSGALTLPVDTTEEFGAILKNLYQDENGVNVRDEIVRIALTINRGVPTTLSCPQTCSTATRPRGTAQCVGPVSATPPCTEANRKVVLINLQELRVCNSNFVVNPSEKFYLDVSIVSRPKDRLLNPCSKSFVSSNRTFSMSSNSCVVSLTQVISATYCANTGSVETTMEVVLRSTQPTSSFPKVEGYFPLDYSGGAGTRNFNYQLNTGRISISLNLGPGAPALIGPTQSGSLKYSVTRS